MELNESLNIVKTLAQGIHPTTGEVFPQESPYNDPEVIRALFSVLELSKHPRGIKRSAEERRRENLEAGRARNSGLPWTEDDRALVASGFQNGMTVKELAAKIERSSAAIVAEIIRQDLVPANLK